MARFIVYGLTDPRSSIIRYIGKSSSGLNRPRSHVKPGRLSKDRSHKANWLRGLLASGHEPGIVVLAECDNADLSNTERAWISAGRAQGWPLTNLTDGGEGMSGHVPTPEHREKVRQSKVGRPRPDMVGKPRPWLTALNERRMGVPRPDVADRCRAMAGRRLSDETRARMSAAQKGRPKSPEHVAAIAAAKRAKACWGMRINLIGAA